MLYCRLEQSDSLAEIGTGFGQRRLPEAARIHARLALAFQPPPSLLLAAVSSGHEWPTQQHFFPLVASSTPQTTLAEPPTQELSGDSLRFAVRLVKGLGPLRRTGSFTE